MKKSLSIILITVVFSLQILAQPQHWNSSPFDSKVFVESKGQFNKELNTSGEIFCCAKLGNISMYFTKSGVIYRYDKYTKPDGVKADEDNEDSGRQTIHYLRTDWLSAGSPTIILETKQSYYYSYPDGNGKTLQASVFKKLVYKNMYPGIDIEYYFPDGKKGIEYSIIIHPGADVAAVKLKYSGASGMQLNPNGDLVVNSEIGDLTEHSPLTYQQNNDGVKNTKVVVKSNYRFEQMVESFEIKGEYDVNKDVIIDPWTTNPNMTPYNAAYKVDYDNTGNVYAYGSASPYQLVKFNSLGVKQWVYNITDLNTDYEGDFCVDKSSGTCYITEGFNSTGARALKINTNGSLVDTLSGSVNMHEMWRAQFDKPLHQLVIGGGGTNSPGRQIGMLDTNLSTFTPVNIIGDSVCCYDVCMMTLDLDGSTAWIAIAESATKANSSASNSLTSIPLPSIKPYNYMVKNGYTFNEVGSIKYVHGGVGYANAMNGMAASPNWLFMYDGAKLREVNKLTGACIDSINVSTTSFAWGGIDADSCDNVYVGNDSVINIYNSSLSLLSTIALGNTIYSLCIRTNGNLYVGGNNFVSAIPISSSCLLTSTNNIVHESPIINVYPNPNEGVFNLSIERLNQKALIEIYNVLGEEIFEQNLTSGQQVINLSQKASGVYFYRIVTDSKEYLGSGKLIVE